MTKQFKIIEELDKYGSKKYYVKQRYWFYWGVSEYTSLSWNSYGDCYYVYFDSLEKVEKALEETKKEMLKHKKKYKKVINIVEIEV